MSDFNVKFKKILDDLEANIKNSEDLEFVKVQMFNLYNLFFDEINRIEESVSSRMTTIAGTQAILQEKVESLQSKMSNMEKELYMDDDSDFTITCPYCNFEFAVEFEELKDEITCPECNNIIELDWGDDEHSCDCGGCNHKCHEEHNDDNEDM